MLIADPIENSDANDPTLPMLAHDPTEPIDSTEWSDHKHRTELVDPIDQRPLTCSSLVQSCSRARMRSP